MKRRIAITIIAPLALVGTMFADGSYQETTKITNGSVVGATRIAGAFVRGSGDVAKPTSKILMVHGNKMVQVMEKTSTLIDIDKGTITTIDNARRQYTVMTFEQLGKMLGGVPSGTQGSATSSNPQWTASQVKVENTGAVRQFGNLTAHQTRLSITVAGEAGHVTTTMEVWKADAAPGYEEIQAFYKRMSEKASWVQQFQQRARMPSQPGAGEGMVALAQEAAKIKGIPVLEVIRMSLAVDAAGSAKSDSSLLEEITTERSDFSMQPAVLSEFEVPAGYREVPSPLLKYMK